MPTWASEGETASKESSLGPEPQAGCGWNLPRQSFLRGREWGFRKQLLLETEPGSLETEGKASAVAVTSSSPRVRETEGIRITVSVPSPDDHEASAF